MKTSIKNLVNFLESLNIENFYPSDYISQDDEITDFDQLVEHLDDNNAFTVEIIYYSNAIKYLQENDPSLQESLSIASEYGFEVSRLNSEMLASLLATENLRSDFYSHQSEIESFFEEIEQED